MKNMKRLLPSLVIALAAMFFGIAAYITIGEQPARLALPDGPMLAEWKISVRIGTAIQATLAVVTGILALITWRVLRNWRWAFGGLVILANWPWTLSMIAPINSSLAAMTVETAGPGTRALIQQWGQLHSMRTGFGLAALLVFIWANSRGK